jgi:hypothetical protein
VGPDRASRASNGSTSSQRLTRQFEFDQRGADRETHSNRFARCEAVVVAGEFLWTAAVLRNSGRALPTAIEPRPSFA